MSFGQLADLLSDISAMIREGNSFEGFIEYLMPDPYEEGDVDVRARVRTGNRDGQGGMMIVGEFV
jgi:hypothetical protein